MKPDEAQYLETLPDQLKVGILWRDPETLKQLEHTLSTLGGAVLSQSWPAASTYLPAMIEQADPHLLLLESAGQGEAELRTLDVLLARHRALSVILLCPQRDPDFLLAAMRHGVREVLQTPLERPALLQAVNRLRERLFLADRARAPGQVLALMPCKGGSGATFLASNLGCALAAGEQRVCLIDLNLHFGDAALHVSEQAPTSTVVDAIAQIQRLDSALLAANMLRVRQGFDLLAAPDSPAQAVEVRPEHVERLIAVARHAYDFVILDVSRTLDVNVVKALDCCDRILLVLQATLPFIRDAGRLLQIFASLGYPREKLGLLLNRFEREGEIGPDEIGRTLGQTVDWLIPNRFGVVAESVNHGHPVIELAPRDPLSRSLREMAASLAPVAASAGGWWQRLIRRAA